MSNAHTHQGIIRARKTLSIMPTYTCTAACTHCASLSSPKERTNLDLDIVFEAIRQAKDLNFYNVVFTGGEATLRWKDLLTAIEFAHSLGFPIRLVTNAHWAHSLEKASSRLDDLIARGLSEINYSTGDEHVRFVPLQRVVNATVAAVQHSFRVTVVIELRAQRRVSKVDFLKHPMIAALTAEQMEYVHVIESPWMPLNPELTEQYPDGVAVDSQNVNMRLGCNNVLQTYTLQADGRVGACCGIGMRTIPELNVVTTESPNFLYRAIDEAEDDFLKLWIHCKGPEKLLAWAAEKNPEIKWEGMYAHHCQACARVYKDPAVKKVIFEHYEEMVSEVIQSAWLDEEYIPMCLNNGHGEHL